MIVSLYVLFEALSAIYCLHCLYGEEVRCDKATIGIVLVEVMWMQLLYFNNWNYNLSWLIYPIIALYCGIRFGFNIKAIFINNILWIILISVLQVGIMLFASICLNIATIGEKESLIINVIIFLLLITFFKKLKPEIWSKVLQSNEKIIGISIVIIVVALIYFYINYKSSKGTGIVYYSILVISLLVIITSIIDIGKHKVKTKEIEAELRLHKLYEESFQNLVDDIRLRQHEFDNHINTIYSQHYLYNTYEELVEAQNKYCHDIEKDNKYNKLLSKGNPIILGFLYSKFTEANRLGIDIEYKVQIEDMNSSVPIHKVVELLGNLINNAVEALQKQEELNKMKVIVLERTHEIVIRVGNECKNINQESIQNFFLKGYSERGARRGYGLYNVAKTCEEYGIILEPTITSGDSLPDRLHFTLIINKPL